MRATPVANANERSWPHGFERSFVSEALLANVWIEMAEGQIVRCYTNARNDCAKAVTDFRYRNVGVVVTEHTDLIPATVSVELHCTLANGKPDESQRRKTTKLPPAVRERDCRGVRFAQAARVTLPERQIVTGHAGRVAERIREKLP
jgi:hypothetical protein